MTAYCTTIIDAQKKDENISVNKFYINTVSVFYDDYRHPKYLPNL